MTIKGKAHPVISMYPIGYFIYIYMTYYPWLGKLLGLQLANDTHPLTKYNELTFVLNMDIFIM